MYFCLLPDRKMLFPFETVRTQKRRSGGEGEIEKCLLEVLRRQPPAPPPPPAPLSEDKHFFKGILPALQRLPPHAKEHMEFQMYCMTLTVTIIQNCSIWKINLNHFLNRFTGVTFVAGNDPCPFFCTHTPINDYFY